MLNNRISEAKSPTAKDKLIKMRDNKIQEELQDMIVM